MQTLEQIQDFKGRYPKQIWPLFFSEMWERFCFYGMRGMLVFFMISQLNFEDAKANLQYGATQAFVYAFTFIGGLFADKILGFRKSLYWGGLLMIVGSVILSIDPHQFFFLGISFTVIGTGFFKPNISTMVGYLYKKGDARTDAGFSLFYAGINLGALIGGYLCIAIGKGEMLSSLVPADKRWNVPCLFQVRNAALSMGITNPVDQATYIGNGSPRSLFQVGTDKSYWFWPGAGFASGDTAYIFQNRIRHTGASGGWAFEGVDSLYVAKINIKNMQVVGYSYLGAKNMISFNYGVITTGNYIYIYCIKNNGFGNNLYVARCAGNNIYVQWEYYNGSSWSKDIAAAAKIHSEFTSSFYVCKIGSKYVLITTEFSVGCDQGKEIYAYTSDNPFGPFKEKKVIWKVDDLLQGHYPMFYLASAHPEFDNGKKELLVTYCINGYESCINICVNNRKNPDYYRPKAIRVPYKFIHENLN